MGETGRSTTREKLVDAARELFWEHGYAATGLAEVLAKAGVRGGSLYHFFKSKEELLRAVLEHYLELLHPVVIDPAFARANDPIERVFAVLAGYRASLAYTECRHGCPIARIALEVTEANDATRALIARNFDNWASAVRRALDEAGDRLPADVKREDLSRFVLTVMEGAVMQAQAHRDLSRFDAVVNQLRDYFNRLLAVAASNAKPGTKNNSRRKGGQKWRELKRREQR
jgi:TetR/AcrR family transcriptional regulator, transcriptional repressor for nem operon